MSAENNNARQARRAALVHGSSSCERRIVRNVAGRSAGRLPRGLPSCRDPLPEPDGDAGAVDPPAGLTEPPTADRPPTSTRAPRGAPARPPPFVDPVDALRDHPHEDRMPDRSRYYLTTAIAYPNNKPGLHTLYEVIGADVIARWHRMKGDDTRFLTGTDEHSVNIAESAAAQGRDTREFVDEMVGLFTSAEDAAADRAGPVHPDDRPGSPARVAGDGPTGPRERRRLPRQVRGLVLPERGLQGALRPARDARRDALPQPPDHYPPVADGAQLVLPPVGLRGPAPRPLRGVSGLGPARIPQERDARLHPRRPRRHLDQPRDLPLGHPVPDRRERRDRGARGRLLGPGSRRDLRLVRRADQLHHRRRASRTTRTRSPGTGPPTSTSSARTSTGSTRSSGRRCS